MMIHLVPESLEREREPPLKFSKAKSLLLVRILAKDRTLTIMRELLREKIARASLAYGPRVAEWPAVEVASLMELRNALRDKLTGSLAMEATP